MHKSVCDQILKYFYNRMLCYSVFMSTFVALIRFLWRNGCFFGPIAFINP